jgi:hypothetical protein
MAVLLNFIRQLHQLSGFEFSNLTLLVGVLVSSNIRRVYGINPGGVVAAPFLILALVSSPIWACSLLIMGIVIALLYKKFFSRVFLGRQPLFIMAGMSVASMTLIGTLLQHYKIIPPTDLNYPLGIILPAILASTITKQGIAQTYQYTFFATALTAIGVTLIYATGTKLGYDFHGLDNLIAQRETLHIGWGALLSLLSIGIGFVIYKIRGVKSAGYIMLPFLATMCVVSPWNFVIIIGLAALSYGITCLMRRYSLIVGIGRYTFVAALSVALVWTAEYILLHKTATFSPFMGTSVFAALAIAVLVNEHSIYGVRKAAPMLALSLAIMVGIELGGAYSVQALSHQSASIRSLTVHTHKRDIPSIPQVLGGK